MTLTERQNSLFECVKIFHSGQKRKYTGDPYHVHLIGVADLVQKYVDDPLAVEIALCHDLYEDTDCNMGKLDYTLQKCYYHRSEIIQITVGVMHLTDIFTSEKYPELNRSKRKQLEAERLGKTDSLIHSIKYADMIDNMKTIVEFDQKFAKVYLSELRYLIECMRDGNNDLLILCCHNLMDAEMYLEKFHKEVITK